MGLDDWLQVAMAVSGLVALLLVTIDRREGFVVGLAGQPIWIIVAGHAAGGAQEA